MSRWKREGARQGEREYRRGFLVGVTLAEVCILLVFVLLLLSAAERARRDEAHTRVSQMEVQLKEIRNGSAELVQRSEVDRLRSRDEIVKNLEAASGVDLDEEEYFDVLVRDLRTRSDEFERFREALRQKLEELKRLDAEGLSQQILEQARQIDHLKAQKAELLGKGLEFPSCIPAKDGGTAFAYDLKLSEGGISGAATPVARAFGREVGIPIPSLDPAVDLTAAEFMARTRGLYDWSVQKECRFVVRVVDATAESSKVRYKELLSAVESNFYKSLADESRGSG